MQLITQGKSNRKFILIAVVSAIFVGVWILAWYYIQTLENPMPKSIPAPTPTPPTTLTAPEISSTPEDTPLFNCKDGACMNITVLSPNGGQRWERRGSYKVNWISSGIDYPISVKAVFQDYYEEKKPSCREIFGSDEIEPSLGNITLSVPNNACLGNYKIQICKFDEITFETSICDESNKSLKVVISAPEVFCGSYKTYDSASLDGINFGTIRTGWSKGGQGRGWIYYSDYFKNTEPTLPTLYMGIANTSNIEDVDCSKVTLYEKDPTGEHGAFLVSNGQILCMKQDGYYGALIPLVQTSDQSNPDFMTYNWYFNNDELGTFKGCDFIDCTDSDGGDQIYTKGIITIKNPKGGQWNYTDYCQDPTAVQEYNCLFDSSTYTEENAAASYLLANHQCLKGCKDGACIK